MSEVAVSKSFQEKMFDKIKEQMGELMGPEELKTLVDTAMQKAFFEPRRSSDGYHSKELPPYFVELVQKEMQTQITAAMKEWIDANREQVHAQIEASLAKGMTGLVLSHFDTALRWPLQQMAEQLRQKGVL